MGVDAGVAGVGTYGVVVIGVGVFIERFLLR